MPRGNDNEKAQAHGISKSMRQYARRHGKSVDDIIQMHAKHPHSYRAHDRKRNPALKRWAGMSVTITPTFTTLEKLAELRRLREGSGRPWPGDEAMLVLILARGMVDELDDERFIRRLIERGPFAEAPAGKFGMVREQAV